MQNSQQTKRRETNLIKLVSARFSELFAISPILNFENIHPSAYVQAISNEENILLCWNVNENCDVDFAIDRADCQSKKQQEKTTLQVFLFLFSRSASPSGIYGALFLPLTLLTTTAKKKTLFTGIHVYSRKIVGFTVLSCGLHSRVCAKYDLAKSRF